jgi:hypothetical protein
LRQDSRWASFVGLASWPGTNLSFSIESSIAAADSVSRKKPQVTQLFEQGYTLPIKSDGEDAHHLTLILRDVGGIAGYAVALADDAVLAIFR